MASNPPGFKIKITPKNPAKNFGKVIKDVQSQFSRDISGINSEILRAARARTPVHSGLTRDSWKSQYKVTRTGKGTVILSNPLPTVKFLQTGTRSSPGMFLWGLRRRAVNPAIGFHPGIRSIQLLDNIEEDSTDISMSFTRRLHFKMKRSVARKF